jgi:hypothetical protein
MRLAAFLIGLVRTGTGVLVNFFCRFVGGPQNEERDDDKLDQEVPGRSLPAALLIGLVDTNAGVLISLFCRFVGGPPNEEGDDEKLD